MAVYPHQGKAVAATIVRQYSRLSSDVKELGPIVVTVSLTKSPLSTGISPLVQLRLTCCCGSH